jgi:Holliday junction resolvase RusA-like endonuclease
MLLRPLTVPEGDLFLSLEWGFSNAGSDFDNPVKPFTDCLQKKYNFNDNRIIESHIKKVKVKKGDEYINFELRRLDHAGN